MEIGVVILIVLCIILCVLAFIAVVVFTVSETDFLKKKAIFKKKHTNISSSQNASDVELRLSDLSKELDALKFLYENPCGWKLYPTTKMEATSKGLRFVSSGYIHYAKDYKMKQIKIPAVDLATRIEQQGDCLVWYDSRDNVLQKAKFDLQHEWVAFFKGGKEIACEDLNTIIDT